MPHKVLKVLWKSVTGDSDIVDIRAVKDPKKAAEYVARYAARPAQLESLDIGKRLHVMWALHGRRLCGSWGTAKEVSLTARKPATEDEYFSVCRFEDLKRLAERSEFAEKIRYAFTTGSPLEIQCTRPALVALYEEMCRNCADNIPPPPKPLQGTLFDTGPASNCAS